MKAYAAAFVASLASVFILDMVWIGLVMHDFYAGDALGDHGRIVDGAMQPNFFVMPFSYLLFGLGFAILVWPRVREMSQEGAAYLGAFFGLFTYGTYHLTNLMILQDWNASLAVADMFYGVIVGAIVTLAMKHVTEWLSRKKGWA